MDRTGATRGPSSTCFTWGDEEGRWIASSGVTSQIKKLRGVVRYSKEGGEVNAFLKGKGGKKKRSPNFPSPAPLMRLRGTQFIDRRKRAKEGDGSSFRRRGRSSASLSEGGKDRMRYSFNP